MIPHEKSLAVARALQQTFGVTHSDDILQITKGHTQAVVFRIVVRGTAYLLRINMRPHSIGPQRYFACMTAAAAAGLAPRVLYTSAEDEVAITDFIHEILFSQEEALVRMPGVLRALHALPPFPDAVAQLNTTCTFLLQPRSALEGFFAGFQNAVQAASALPAETSAQLLALHAELAPACPREPSDLVSCHNDLFKPDNILFDGNHVWLVDWEAAFRNDRYADLAVVANLLLSESGDSSATHSQERAFLGAYFDREPTAREFARFFVMHQLAHLFYAMAFLMIGASGHSAHDSTIRFQDFRRRFWTGELNLDNAAEKFTFGRVNMEQLFENTRQPRYRESLKLLTSRPSRMNRHVLAR